MKKCRRVVACFSAGLSGFVMTTLRVEKYAFHAVLMMFLGAFGQLLIVLGVH
jgi:hypothetical protein